MSKTLLLHSIAINSFFFTDLIKLTVEMWSDYTNHISDHTIHYGIMELRRLKEFHGIRVPVRNCVYNLLSL
jgi:hypothetical protein